MHSSSETFVKNASHLAQRLFDPIPEVRLAVSEIAGQLALDWNYRHSNLPYLLPLCITG